MTPGSLFRALRKSRILIAVKESQDVLDPMDASRFQRQVFCLMKKVNGECAPGHSMARIIKQILQKNAAFSRIRTASSFSQFTHAVKDGVCVVDFYTRWFPVTSQRLLELDRLAKGLCPKAVVVMVDLDAAPELTTRLSIVVLPTLLVYANGTLQDRHVGARTSRQLGRIVGTTLTSQNLVPDSQEFSNEEPLRPLSRVKG